jgi:hypothetical protein
MQHAKIRGKTLEGTAVTPFIFVGVTTLDELEHFGIKSPWLMAKMSLNKTPPEDQPGKQLRVIVQRAWDKARSQRADAYKQYIRNLAEARINGGTPPVTVYVSQQGMPSDNGLLFNYGTSAIAIDGETQLEARFRLREDKPETGALAFPITIYHGITEEHAIQILHDFNAYAKPIPESKLGSRNASGGLSQTVQIALGQAGLTDGALNSSGAFGTKKFVAGFAQSMFFVSGYAMQADGLKRSASSMFATLNEPGAPPINNRCSPMLASLYSLATNEMKVRLAPTFLWQVAGVLAAEGVAPHQLNWDAALAAYKTTSKQGRGGAKMRTNERLARFYAAFKTPV